MILRGNFSPRIHLVCLLAMFSCISSPAQQQTDTNAIAVHMQVDEELNSATAAAGQEVPMHVANAVTKDGREIISAGASVKAHVTRVKRPSHGDRNGQIKLTMVSVQTPSGQWVELHKGKIRSGHRFIAIFAGPCSVPFPLTMMMIGEDVKIPKGQALTAYVRTKDLP